MANEFKHTNVGSEITQDEYHDVLAHQLDSQATGDIVYASSSTQLSRLARAADNTILTLSSNIPAWTATPTLTSLTIGTGVITDDVITFTPTTSDTVVMTAATNGAFSIVTTDAAAAAANIQITADGTVDIDSAGVLTLDSGAAINIEPAAGSAILLDGTISIDAGVVTGATSITSTAFVGDVTGNVSGTAATVTGSAQSAITSVGTLTSLTVDYANINASTLKITDSTDTGDYASLAVTTHGATTLTTIDDDATAAHLVLDVDGNIELNADGGTITFADAGSGLGTITSSGYSGNAATATALATARNINGVSFDGTGNITVTAAGSTLSDTVTVAKGGTGATSLTDKAVLISQDSGTDTVGAVALTSSGQIIIGGSSGPAAATLTAGSGVTITNGDGSISIAASGGVSAGKALAFALVF
jgi:hypothetical protein